jgi:hypothetical protein
MVSRFVRVIASVLIIVLMVSTVGCYGSFELVKKVHKWNGTLGDKWLNEVAFLALNIVPVYGISVLIDAWILNAIEFWTGKNPMLSATDNSILITKDGMALRVTATDEGALVTDASGTVLARSVRTVDGVTVYDGQGNRVGSMTNDQIASSLSAQ